MMDVHKRRVFASFAAICGMLTANTAAAEQSVLLWDLPHSGYATSDNPPCTQSIRLTEMLSSNEGVKAFAASNRVAAVVLESVNQIASYAEGHGGSVAGFITDMNGGSRSQCETKCALLPGSAIIDRIQMSGAEGNDERHFYSRTDPNPFDGNSPNILTYGGVLNAASTGDYAGWEGLTVNKAANAVCATAKNWSSDRSSHQVLRVIYHAP